MLRRTKPVHITEAQESVIKDRLGRRIHLVRIASLTTGLDSNGVQTRIQHDSYNHSVLYVELEDDGIARFSMENKSTAKKGFAEMDDLIMKFQNFKNGF